jgi:hypothetical protein
MTSMISPQPLTALTVTRAAGREYQLTDQHRRVSASLRVGWPARRGEISIEQDSWPVHRHVRGQVTAGESDEPLVRLSRADSLVPGPEPDANWVITRKLGTYHATLTRASANIVIDLPALSGRRFALKLTGDWERRDLVLLTACFALLARRRRDIAIMIAISSSHGS